MSVGENMSVSEGMCECMSEWVCVWGGGMSV